MREGDFFTRHTKRPKESELESADFREVSEDGVELAKQRAAKILESLDKLENGTVMFVGGTSEIPRTKSTALIYGEEIKKIVLKEKRDDILVFLSEDLEKIEGYINKANFLVDQITAKPEKKIIIDAPLFIKEFSFVGDFTTKEGRWAPYTQELLKRNNGDSEKSLRAWLENQGIIGEIKGPNPKEVAEKQLAGLNRLRKFIKKYISDRPFVIGSVGHSWSLDALALYLVNKDEVSAKAFDDLKARMIGDAEAIEIIEKGGKQVLRYGELEIPFSVDIQN